MALGHFLVGVLTGLQWHQVSVNNIEKISILTVHLLRTQIFPRANLRDLFFYCKIVFSSAIWFQALHHHLQAPPPAPPYLGLTRILNAFSLLSTMASLGLAAPLLMTPSLGAQHRRTSVASQLSMWSMVIQSSIPGAIAMQPARLIKVWQFHLYCFTLLLVLGPWLVSKNPICLFKLRWASAKSQAPKGPLDFRNLIWRAFFPRI